MAFARGSMIALALALALGVVACGAESEPPAPSPPELPATPAGAEPIAACLALELGDLPTAKDRLRALRSEPERIAGELATSRVDLPTLDDLRPMLWAKLRDFEETLRADRVRGRMALGALLDGERLRVYADGRIEGTAILSPEVLHPPKRRASGGADRDVAGGSYARVCALPVPLGLLIAGKVSLALP